MRILVVDDSLTIRALLEGIFENASNCEVVGLAADVDQARQFIASEAPDVITLDLSLPGTDGLTFLDELGQHAHAPVIVISSSTSPGSFESGEAMRRGAVACFDKARLIPDAARLVKLLKHSALEHQRMRLADMEKCARADRLLRAA
ncbi:response regulator [Sphingomonas sp. BIUV-7]|uniref:Response regulator n=1 Tax=Sphingomonas natans TaxID=3063330 RepID=A0ABT8YDT9_9SPHN|nr:response regulator [Sphingomonas sp. BIUV-7]MDO6416513.1 response regulator [Sphingomonas sp. BIUV-7]